MPRPVRPWFRFYTEAFNDRKLRRLKPEYRWLFTACLGAARQSPEPGVLLVAEGVPMNASDLADWAGMDVRTVKAGMRSLQEMGLIVESSLGDRQEIAWSSPTFLHRQYESDNVTKRTRKHRATRDDGEEGTFQRSSEERSREREWNGPETETETETDIKTPSEIASDPDDHPREEVRALCERLAEKVRENGHSANPGKLWFRECRLLLDRDGRTPKQVQDAIDWATADPFWSTNIRSMRNLRQKYSTLRGQATLKTRATDVVPVRTYEPAPPPAESELDWDEIGASL